MRMVLFTFLRVFGRSWRGALTRQAPFSVIFSCPVARWRGPVDPSPSSDSPIKRARERERRALEFINGFNGGAAADHHHVPPPPRRGQPPPPQQLQQQQSVSPRIALSLDQDDEPTPQPVPRREIILRSSELAVVGAIFQFGGKKPEYLGVQKSTPALALCPATKNCVSTSENIADPNHYAPPWNYNPEGGRGRKNPVSREVAKEELIEVIKSLKPDKFTPRIVENKDDYLRVEYESPILGFVDDVEFWFPPGKDSIVEYRSASRMGNFDFDINRKRIKALRLELEKKGWASQDSF